MTDTKTNEPDTAGVAANRYKTGQEQVSAMPIDTAGGDAPTVLLFKINYLGGAYVVAEGNDTFCHSHEVKAYMNWAESTIAALSPKPAPDKGSADAVVARMQAYLRETVGGHAVSNIKREVLWSARSPINLTGLAAIAALRGNPAEGLAEKLEAFMPHFEKLKNSEIVPNSYHWQGVMLDLEKTLTALRAQPKPQGGEG